MLGGDGRGELGHDELRDGAQLPLTLHQPRDPREVRLEPVLLLVAIRGVAQVGDHLVDVVLQLGNLTLRLDGDRTCEVALCHGGRHLRDRTHLCREISGELVDVLSQVTPSSRDALDLSLTAELAFGADLARHARHLVREGGELVHHDVDRVLQLEDLALRIDRDLLREIALCDRGRHLRDVAHLIGEIRGHGVDVLRQPSPGPRNAFDLGLAAELALRADLARDARHLGRERAQLVDHRVDRVCQRRDLALGLHRDLL